MKLNANFQSKQPAMEEAPCEVCKVICLTDKEYAFFKKHFHFSHFQSSFQYISHKGLT